MFLKKSKSIGLKVFLSTLAVFGAKELKASSNLATANTAASVVTFNSGKTPAPLISSQPTYLYNSLSDTRNGSFVQVSGLPLLSDLEFTPDVRIQKTGKSGKTIIVATYQSSPSVKTNCMGTITITTKDGKGIVTDFSTIRYDLAEFIKDHEELQVFSIKTSKDLLCSSMGSLSKGSSNTLGTASSIPLFSEVSSAIAPAFGQANTTARQEPIISATFLILTTK
jgi:hypothetical protein